VEKERLDVLLVMKGFFQSREKARSGIMAGTVYVNGKREDKPGTRFPEGCEIEVRENGNPYVSRGGLKLEKAVREFGINLEGLICIDVGASTGGFTDCMLKNGALKVFAIDVGYGQLAWELRNDSRVVCMERTNIRYVKPEDIGIAADFASIDVSFISLRKVLPAVKSLLKDKGEIVCLVKPQFEAGRENVGKHGVVKDEAVHRRVMTDLIHFALESGFAVKGMSYSPIKGPEGNIEYLVYLSGGGVSSVDEPGKAVEKVVEESHMALD